MKREVCGYYFLVSVLAFQIANVLFKVGRIKGQLNGIDIIFDGNEKNTNSSVTEKSAKVVVIGIEPKLEIITRAFSFGDIGGEFSSRWNPFEFQIILEGDVVTKNLEWHPIAPRNVFSAKGGSVFLDELSSLFLEAANKMYRGLNDV
jgi:hypothetical protein